MLDTVTLSVGVDHARVPPGPASLYVVVELAGRGAPLDARPPLQVVFALDVSGSMQGPPLEQLQRSVDSLVGLLAAEDRLGVVAFADAATEVSPLALLTADARRAVRRRVARLRADGMTNIAGALERARASFAAGAQAAGARRSILLLSDGEPNVGASTAGELAGLARGARAVASVSVLGYGAHHDESVLAAIADGGGGVYRFVPDPATSQLGLAQALGAQCDVVAEGLELVVAPEAGVEIRRVLGSPPARFAAEGLVLALPDLVDGATRLVVIEVRAELGWPHAGDLLRARLRYRRAGSGQARELEGRASVDVAQGPPARDDAAFAKVLLLRAEEARAEARSLADRGNFEGAAVVLRTLIAEIGAAPGLAVPDGSPLAEARELLLDEAIAYERRPAREDYAVFRKQSVGTSLACDDGHRASTTPLSPVSRAYGAAGAGLFPEAQLVVAAGREVGRSYPLAAQNTIGRTSSADIVIASRAVSRRHTDIFALEGEFWVADLGSTNTTCVNNRPLGHEPHRLVHGDVIQVGDVALRYEEL
jgi:Ca-activated chloride channel family protein